MKYAIALVAASISTAAVAQATPPTAYVPIVIDEQSYNQIKTYLQQQPYMFSARLMQWLDAAEMIAIQAELDRKKKEEEKSKEQPK